MTAPAPRSAKFGDLGLRLASGLAMAAAALGVVWLGGVWLALGAAVLTALMLWELRRVATGDGAFLAPRMLLLGSAGSLGVLAAWGHSPALAIALVYAGASAVFLTEAPGGRRLLAAGLVYIATAMAVLLVVRAGAHGFAVVIWLALVVIAADVAAYFVGRSVGGARLWPAVSPGKTWSGALGGLVGAAIVGMAFAATHGWSLPRIGLLSIGIAVASQAGDLLESAVKRRFGVKDASRLIPGHGGLLDRLDGLVAALWVFAIYTLLGGSVS